ncbi:MAG: hypothetical protein WDM91_00615 [Rhizomicrobium sp.]
MLGRDEHDALVGRLYAAALGDLPWATTLESFAEHFGSSKAVVQLLDGEERLLGFDVHGYSTDFAAQFYTGEIYRNDPRVPYFRKVPPGAIYFDQALYDVEAINRDPGARACSAALGVKYQIGAVMGLPGGIVASIALFRTEAEGHVSQSQIGAWRRLAPHMAQALTLGQVVQERAATQAALLDALARRADGVILLDASGQPSFMNDAAHAILGAGDGLAFARGEVTTQRGPETRRLRSLIANATAIAPPSEAQPGGEMLLTRRGGRRPYVLRIMAAPRFDCFLAGGSIAAVMHIHDLAAVRVPPKSLLMAAFGLTEREADLAIALVRCAGLAGAAADAGMAPNTARNHLQAIFRKSGTASQAEAVQLFSRLA